MKERYWFLKRCQLFAQIPDERLGWLETQSRIKKFAKGSPIYLPLDYSDGVMLLLEGQVKLCHTTADGKQSILAFINPGELFGETALFDDGDRGEHAETTKASTVVLMPADAVRQVAELTPRLAMGISKLVGLRRKRIERRLKYLLFHSNRERLVHLLLELAEDYGEPQDDGQVKLSIRLSHQDLASIIGSTRESVTVLLGQMQAESLVSIGRRRIEIRSLDALARSINVATPRLRSITQPLQARAISSAIGRVAF